MHFVYELFGKTHIVNSRLKKEVLGGKEMAVEIRKQRLYLCRETRD